MYKEKKKIKDTVVYQYSPHQISRRNTRKKKKVQLLERKISKLRAKLCRDLKLKDEKKRLTALAISLIDKTYERVGNEQSAEDGHFGVTGWKRKHVRFGKGKAIISYVGKSGVKHRKEVDAPHIVQELKRICKNKSSEDCLFQNEEVKVTAKDVNAYLQEFDVTAKDLRGYHANQELMQQLKNSKPKLPEKLKDKKVVWREEFNKALELAAKAVGHKPATLRNQYLIPEMIDKYLSKGEVPDSVTKLAAKYILSTLSYAEKEEREVERNIRKTPQKKPPRTDKQRRRIEMDDDPDFEKEAAEKKKPGEVWKNDKGEFRAKNIKTKEIRTFTSEETATSFARDQDPEKLPEEPKDKPSKDPEPESKELTPEQKELAEQFSNAVSEFLGRVDPKIAKRAQELLEEDGLNAIRIFRDTTQKIRMDLFGKKTMKALGEAITEKKPPEAPEDFAQHLAKLYVIDHDLLDPNTYKSNINFDEDDRRKKLLEKIEHIPKAIVEKMDLDSHKELKEAVKVMAMAKGEPLEIEGEDPPAKAMMALADTLHSAGMLHKLMDEESFSGFRGQQLLHEVIQTVDEERFFEIAGGKDGPYGGIIDAIQKEDVSDQAAKYGRELITRLIMNDVKFGHEMILSIARDNERYDTQFTFDELAKAVQDVKDEALEDLLFQDNQRSAIDCLTAITPEEREKCEKKVHKTILSQAYAFFNAAIKRFGEPKQKTREMIQLEEAKKRMDYSELEMRYEKKN